MEKVKDFFTKIWAYLEKLKKAEKEEVKTIAPVVIKEPEIKILAPTITFKEVDNTIIPEPVKTKKAVKKKAVTKKNKK